MEKKIDSRMPVATGVSVTLSEDRKHVGLAFRTENGIVSVAIPVKNLGDMIAHLIKVAEDDASLQVTKTPDGEISTLPIPVAIMGVGQGRSVSEALLAIKTGPMTLTFAVELEVLLGVCSDLQKKAVKQQKPNPAN